MVIRNSKGVFYRDYIVYKGKIIYYNTPKRRLPHQGKREYTRRIKQYMKRLKQQPL